MENIYLVLQHVGGKNGSCRCGDQVYHDMHDRSMDRNVARTAYLGHDIMAHCLKVHKNTYKNREEADVVAKEIMVKYPQDYCWSLEVDVPD